MQELLELMLKRIETLEKKLERYYAMIKIENELDFILNGSYIMPEDITSVVEGTY